MSHFNITWAENGFEDTPAGSSPANQLDTRIQELKLAIRQRTEIEHYWAGDEFDGVHKLPYLGSTARDALTDKAGQVVLSSDAARISYNDGSAPWIEVVGFDIGDLKIAAYLTAPFGWEVCDGTSLLRAGTYNDLFLKIGVLYGSVDGTHFSLPDMQNNIPIGKAGSGTFSTLGFTDGAFIHQLSVPEIPAHAHTFTGNSVANHQHAYFNVQDAQAGGNVKFDGGGSADHSAPSALTDAQGGHTPTGTIAPTGGTDSHQNTQPSLAMQYFIRYA